VLLEVHMNRVSPATAGILDDPGFFRSRNRGATTSVE
jgi:hypothetical protein